MGGATEALRCLTLYRSISKCIHDVIHGWKLALTSPLGALPEFVPMMLDLRLVSQRHLQDHKRNTGRSTMAQV